MTFGNESAQTIRTVPSYSILALKADIRLNNKLNDKRVTLMSGVTQARNVELTHNPCTAVYCSPVECIQSNEQMNMYRDNGLQQVPQSVLVPGQRAQR